MQEITKDTSLNFSGIVKILKDNKLLILILAIIVFLAYFPLLGGQFLNMDDENGIVYNANIKNLSYMFQTGRLYNIETALLYKLVGLNGGVFHATSIIWHFINTVLFFLFVYILLGKEKALISSLLFAVHPLASEAVGWISAQHYLHITLFMLLILISHTLYKRSNQTKYYIGEILIYLLATLILRNAQSLTIPFVLLVFDQFVLEKKINFKSALKTAPIFIAGGILAYFSVFGLFNTRVVDLREDYYFNPTQGTPILNRTPYIIFTIADLMVLPVALTVYREGNAISTGMYVFMTLFTIAVFVLSAVNLKKHRSIVGFFLMIIMSTLPSFSPIAIAWFVAERYLYFATTIFCILLATFLLWAEKKYKIKNFAITATVILSMIYSVKTAIRANELKNSKNLWVATQKVSPYSYRVYNNLGDVYTREGNYDLAIENFKMSVSLQPDYADAVHNIGYIYMLKSDMENAKKYLEKSFEMNPRLYGSAYKLGVIAYKTGDYKTAKMYFEKVLQLSPTDASAAQSLQLTNQALSQTGQ